ncbi:MAG: hypothetical protein AAB396_00405, partial [Patescibacteria group bacterium]
MQIIPAINCADFECVKEKLQKIEEIGAGWAHIDVADGIFTPHKTWVNLKDLLGIKNQLSNINLEIHLMIENPESVIDDWVKAGIKRIIIHIEAINIVKFKKLISRLAGQNIKIGLAINPKTPIENIVSYLSATASSSKRFVQILAVDPGLSGQKFQLQVLEKIKFLKKNYPDVVVEADGGINLETAEICKSAGADILVSFSYIWD